MNCVSCDICVYRLGLCVFFPGVFLSSRVTGACPVTTRLIMRVNVRNNDNNTPLGEKSTNKPKMVRASITADAIHASTGNI